MKKTAIICLLVCGLVCCKNANRIVLRNKDIPEKDRNEIQAIISKVYSGFVAKDASYIKSITSKFFKTEEFGLLDTMMTFIPTGEDFSKRVVIDECLIENGKDYGTDSIESVNLNPDGYIITFEHETNPFYIYMFSVFNGGSNRILISCFFLKENGLWKLRTLFIGPYLYNGETAPQIYARAKKMSDNGNVIGSYLTMAIYSQYAIPAGPLLHYKTENASRELTDTLREKIKEKYSFPLKINDIATAPEIFSLYPQFVGNRYYPLVLYKSSVSIYDTVSLGAENKKLHKVIGEIFPGMFQFSDTIIYHVTNQPIGNAGEFKYYGFFRARE